MPVVLHAISSCYHYYYYYNAFEERKDPSTCMSISFEDRTPINKTKVVLNPTAAHSPKLQHNNSSDAQCSQFVFQCTVIHKQQGKRFLTNLVHKFP